MNYVENIVNDYYKLVGYFDVLPTYQYESKKAVQNLIDSGVDVKSIKNAVLYYVDCYGEYHKRPAVNMADIFKIDDIKGLLKYNLDGNENLIEDGVLYFHKKLRKASGTPVLNVDDNGNVTRIKTQFKIEYVKRFTPYDVVNYFYEVHEVPRHLRNQKRDVAAVKYFKNQYQSNEFNVSWLDIVLYMIDVSKRIIDYNGLSRINNLIYVQDYYEEALELLLDKVNYERVGGGLNNVAG